MRRSGFEPEVQVSYGKVARTSAASFLILPTHKRDAINNIINAEFLDEHMHLQHQTHETRRR